FRRGDAPDLFLSTDEFRSEWRSDKRVFVLSDKGFDLPDGAVLAEGPRTVLRVNHPMPDVAAVPSAPRDDPPRRQGS
ncbi:MAG TPA: hypothetical protein VLF14_01320, partial [Candidatus Binatia bacterium]|nr:hypothetical protein [Candidatus Binatia bacterium]